MGEATDKLPSDLKGDMPAFDSLRAYLNDNPKRDAVLKWIDKLEQWCADNLVSGAAADKKNDDYSEQVEKLEEEVSTLRHDMIELESLIEELEDVERGIRTVGEVLDDRRRRAFV